MSPRPLGFRKYVAKQGFHTIYLVTMARNHPVKVGIARDPVRRLWGLQNAHFEQLRIHRFWWFPGLPIAARIEQAFKQNFATAGIRGEWFDLSLSAAEAFIEGSIRSIGAWGIGQVDMLKLMTQSERERIERSLAQITAGRRLAQSLQVKWPSSRLAR